MIKNILSGKLECLHGFNHDLFITADTRELHLWEPENLVRVLVRLEAGGALPDEVTNKGDFYIIKF